MAIHSIPNITINGKTKIYGGYIYKISYEQGFFATPSKMTVSLLSEDGNYSKPKLGLKTSHKIKIGNEVFTMYATTYRIVKNNSARTLDISFVDGSILLNRYVVGLTNKQGVFSKKTKKCLIIVGKEIDPCDDEQEIIDDCGQTTNNADVQRKIDCTELKKTTILEIDYSFEELIDAMKDAGFKIENFKDKNPDYRNRHIGNLREVLNSWCSDYGYSYYFDQDKQAISFIDVSSGIKIKFNKPNNDIILEEIEEETIEGTINRGSISYFGADGQTRCMFENGKKGALVDFKRLLNCTPLSVSSLFETGLKGVSGDTLPTSCLLSKVSSSLRACYYLYHKHSMITYLGKNAVNQITIPEYGNLKFYDCYGSNSTGDHKRVYDAIKEEMFDKTLDSTIKFVLIEFDEALAQEQYSIEQTLATEFMGAYWFAEYGRTNINARPGPPEIITADGDQAVYYDRTLVGSNIYLEVGGDKYPVSVDLDKFILVKRGASFYPEDGAQELESHYSQFIPGDITVVPASVAKTIQDTFTARGVNTVGLDFSKLRIAAIKPPTKFDFSLGSAVHPLESEPVSSADSGGEGINYFYGLMDKTTSSVSIEGAQLIAPVGGLGGSTGQYKIIINDALGIFNKCNTLDKIEIIHTDLKCDEDFETTEINLLDITSLDVKNLYTYDSSLEACVPNKDAIAEKHEEFNTGLTYSTPKTFKKESYRVGGLINMPKPKDGLLSFNIEIDEKGIVTNLTVGNTAATPPSIDYTKARIEFGGNKASDQYKKTLNYSSATLGA